MLLYHISTDIETTERDFIPRVPNLSQNAKTIENSTIPRICFSETVSGCFSALPKYSRYSLMQPNAKFVLYKIETTNLSSEDYLSNSEIVRRKLVYDANITREWWLLKSMHLKGNLCKMLSVQQEKADVKPLIQNAASFKYKVHWIIL